MKFGSMLRCITLLSIAPSLGLAQGRRDYFNVESPQVKPITVARIAGHDYLLVCNTPDNSLEVWDTNESIPVASRFKLRVRTGLEPVSVKFHSALARAYTANFLGDSITVVAFSVEQGILKATPVMTRAVGDEPMDITINNGQLFVTHNTLGTFGWRNASNLNPVPIIPPLTDMTQIDLVEGTTSLRGIKEPRSVAVSAGKLFVLGFKGGNNPAVYDFDVYVRDLSTQAVTAISGLGSTNFNMTFANNGDLWVVGGEAQNAAPNVSEALVANELTGFVRSTVYRIPGGVGLPIERDLNDQDGNHVPVTADKALAQPTDIVTFEPPLAPLKVFIAAFGSDRIGVLSPSTSGPYAWPLALINIPTAPGSTNPMAGPRGLAIKYANSADSTDPGNRLYVMNRLDNSVSIINPNTNLHLETFALKNDPTPDYIRAGRKFLYSAEISTAGFVSCASCHMDGRTDSLVWMLGTPNGPQIPYPDGLADGKVEPDNFVLDKGPMVTQSLQGLLNFEVEPAIQEFFTNAPHHWRGDKADFTDFNSAFVNLLKAPGLPNGNGLSDEEMLEFREFVDSIQYPPNPRQPDTRQFSGDFGTADLETDGVGAALGLKLFHTHPIPVICAGRSCVQCHFLPEGSNNRGTVGGGMNNDLIESAATRGLFQKEARLDKLAGPVSDVVTGEFGLAHPGASLSLNGFINRFTPEFTAAGLLAVKEFMREFDFSVAPLVGRSYTVDVTNKASSETTIALDLFESQAKLCNVGVAVHARIGSQDTGYWLDLTQVPLAYQIEDLSTMLSRSGLLALVVGTRDRLVFTATPLGSERRVASVNGTTVPLTGPAPSALELQPAVANTAFVQIPSLTKNWDPANPVPGLEFNWGGNPNTPPHTLKALRLMQYGLILDGDQLYGVETLGHEAPRRFAIAGSNIRQGAKLHLFVPNDTDAPDDTGPLEQITTIEFVFPIYPTDQTRSDGRRIWQTAVEADPALIYMMMLGGPKAPGVEDVLDPLIVVDDDTPEPPLPDTFNPHDFNWHYVRVENPDGLVGNGGWQQLKVN